TIWSTSSSPASTIANVRAGSQLLVLDPDYGQRFRVYEPAGGREGFVDKGAMTRIDRPDWVSSDPTIWPLEENPVNGLAAARANQILRAVGRLLFLLVALMAIWRMTDLHRFVIASATLMLAAYWL